MLYPYGPYCPTEPKITIKNIILEDIKITNSINPYSGVVRCNETNPCNSIYFTDVNVSTLTKNKGYLCENVKVVSHNCDPIPCKYT
jgi:hypothetical protein